MRKRSKKQLTPEQLEESFQMTMVPITVYPQFTAPFFEKNMDLWTELQHLIFLCGAEARGEFPSGIKAVCQVVLNRVIQQKGYFGKTIKEVIYKHSNKGMYQFSAMKPGDINMSWVDPKHTSTWYKVAKAVLPCYLGGPPEFDFNVLYYHAASITVPKFFRDKLTPFDRIGNHIFYADPNISIK